MQLDKVCEEISRKQGSTYTNEEAEHLFTKAAVSVFMKMIANVQYEFDDEELNTLIQKIQGYQKVFFEEFFTVIIWFDVFPFWLVTLMAHDTIKRCKTSASGIREILQKHLEVSEVDPQCSCQRWLHSRWQQDQSQESNY